jgi:lipopolysaccharide export system protein LptA
MNYLLRRKLRRTARAVFLSTFLLAGAVSMAEAKPKGGKATPTPTAKKAAGSVTTKPSPIPPKQARTPGVPASTAPAAPATAIPTTIATKSATSALEEKFASEDFGKLPTNISSDTLTLNSKERVFTYKGNVTVTQGDMKLVSKTLDGTYDEENRLEQLTAKGNVEITKQDIKATAQLAVYDAKSGIVTLTDNPQLQQKESILTADRIKVFLNENRSQAEGSVRVTLVNDKQGAGLASPFEGAQGVMRDKNKIQATPMPGSGVAPNQAAASVTPKVVVGGVKKGDEE